jgi:hypothetical protein
MIIDGNNTKINRLIVYLAAAVVIAAGLTRYILQPTFWLDEAYVAVSLGEPTAETIFAPLEYGVLFPRIYLAAIALIRGAFGYEIWSLRLLPFLSFAIATILWAKLLAKRSRAHLTLAVLAASFLLGSIFWLDQAIQLKQYTLDVMLALVPFLVADDFFKASMVEGRHRWLLALVAIPILLSYTYPIALLARLSGWYANQARLAGWRVKASSLLILIAAISLAMLGVWATDHRYNIQDRESYIAYWQHCILSSTFEQGIGDTMKLIAKYLWGWHGRQPMVTALVAPLQILGAYSIVRRWKRRDHEAVDSSWGSRSIGSLFLIAGVMLASAALAYPICAGRVVLFTQIHTQILALEGALFILSFSSRRKAAIAFLWMAAAVVLFHSLREQARFLRAEPAENLRPVISMIKPELANTAWVHHCSVAQVRSLPEALPVAQVLLANENQYPQPGQKSWIIWSHLGEEACVKELERVRSRARSWRLIHEGPGRGLALAEF